MQYRRHRSSRVDKSIYNVADSFYNSQKGPKVFDFNVKLKFEKTHPKYPGRAVFTLRAKNDNQERRSTRISAHRRKIFKRLRDDAETGILGEADKSVPGSLIRLFGSPVGMFVVQVRGSLSDCALPALNVDSRRHEFSLEWRNLFNRFFRVRRVATTILLEAPVGHLDCLGLLSYLF